MKETLKADFSFTSYKIIKFWFNNPNTVTEKISVEFVPSGTYSQTKGEFSLNLIFRASFKDSGSDVRFIDLTIESIFDFSDKISLNSMPEYFYANSIAIIFPYIRAFVTTLTSLANVKPLILPLMNLTSITKELKDNTTSIT